MPTPERFEKELDLILDFARTEYKILTIDDRAFQCGMMKTYLWLASLFTATFAALGSALLNKSTGFPFLTSGAPSLIFYFLGGISLLCALSVFCLGVEGLRGRIDITGPGQFKQWGIEAYHAPEEEPLAFRKGLVAFLDDAVSAYAAEVSRVGLRLRKMSWLLLASVAFAVLSLITFCLG